MESGLKRKEALVDRGEYGFSKYLLVAHADKTVETKIQEERNHFVKTYPQKMAIRTHPYITIARFFAREPMEETLLRWMHRIISAQKCFIAALNNYSGFPPHTVYIRVQDYQPFQQLARSLQVVEEYIRSNACPPMELIMRPHLAIARKLLPSVYEQAMMDYSQRTFHEVFMVKELLLLKCQSEFDDCREVARFGMLPVGNNLFN